MSLRLLWRFDATRHQGISYRAPNWVMLGDETRMI